MDTNRLLVWFTVLGVIANVLALFVVRRRPSGRQMLPFVLVYAILGLAMVYRPGVAGGIGFLGFSLLVMLPGLWLQLVNALLMRGRYRTAAVAAFWLRPVILALDDPNRPLTDKQRARMWEIQSSLHLQRQMRVGSKKARGTYVMIALNLVMFLAEIPGGTEDEANLRALGALQIPWHGELWRLVAACFLHYGALHVTMNLLGLALFGRRVEQRVGTARWVAIYLLSGLLGMLLYALLGNLFGVSARTVVGASGCVMGMVGAMLSISYIDWRRRRGIFAGRQVALVAIIVGTQAVFDLMTPEIAMSVHLTGLLIGAVLGALLLDDF